MVSKILLKLFGSKKYVGYWKRDSAIRMISRVELILNVGLISSVSLIVIVFLDEFVFDIIKVVRLDCLLY